ncbi:MAG: Gfo/Idh/MocA family oxidoreductase [Nitrospirae bacterium]|nr:Gfo/Idh/MocA family oxidoreductase [Nitrospirota bacterium]
MLVYLLGGSLWVRAVRDGTAGALLRAVLKPPRNGRRVAVRRGGEGSVRVGLIGFGRQAASILWPAMRQVSSLRLVAVGVRRERVATPAGLGLPDDVALTRGHEAVLNRTDVEAVIIATPTSLHEMLTREALRRGKHVFCEVPGIVTGARGLRLARWAEGADLRVQYDFRFHHAPPYGQLLRRGRDWRAEGRPVVLDVEGSERLHLYTLVLGLSEGPCRVQCEERSANGAKYTIETDDGVRMIYREHRSPRVEKAHLRSGERLLSLESGSELSEVRGEGVATLWRYDGGDDLLKLPEDFRAENGIPGSAYLHARGFIPGLRSFADAVQRGERPACDIVFAARAQTLYRDLVRSRWRAS